MKKISYNYDNVPNIKLGQGRFDYQWGMKNGIFEDKRFYFPSPISELVTRGLEKDFHRITGALPVFANEVEGGDWHRDTLPLFNDQKLNNQLPPWYYTTLIPLTDLTLENGATQFILGSHKCSFEEAGKLPKVQFEAKKGSVILFDGRIFHRGMPNKSNQTRTVLYTVYSKNWYRTYYDSDTIM